MEKLKQQVLVLFAKIMERQVKITKKCVALISSRLLNRVKDSLSSGFRQVPQKLRIQENTSHSEHKLKPSDFLDLIFKPLTSLSQHKYFIRLNPTSKTKLLSEMIFQSFKDLKTTIKEVIEEEEKMQQRLMKYSQKKDTAESANGSTWEELNHIQRLKVQLAVDITYLKHQVILQQFSIQIDKDPTDLAAEDTEFSSLSEEINSLITEGYLLVNKLRYY